MKKRIDLFGEFGYEITAAKLSPQLVEANGADLDAYMASPGGYVSDGIAVFNLFRDYKRKYPSARLSLTVIGQAASMASYNMVNRAFDKVVAYDNATGMIHNIWGGVVGDYRELEKTAQVYRGLTDLVAKAYADRLGKTTEEVRALMDAETWYFGEEMKAAGLVDEIIPAPEGKGTTKSEAVALGKLKVAEVFDKMRKDDRAKDDVLKAAAVLRDSGITYGPPTGGSGVPSRPPVTASQLQGLTLAELKYLNPELYSRFMNLARKETSEAFLGETERQHVPDDGQGCWEAPESAAARDDDPPEPEPRAINQRRQTGENLPSWE